MEIHVKRPSIRLVALLSLAVSVWMSPSVQAQGFDDPTVWTPMVFGAGPTFVISDPKHVTFTLPADSLDDPTAHFFGAWLGTVCRLTGDFDVQMDYELPVWPEGNGVRVSLSYEFGSLGRSSIGPNKSFPPGEYYYTDSGDLTTGVLTVDSSGTLRLERRGGTVTGYYFSPPSSWVVVRSWPGSLQDAHITLAAFAANRYFGGADVQVGLSNFIVTSGQFVCPAAGA